MIEILYNNVNPFTAAIATPLVTISSSSEYRNSRLYEVDRIILRGKIKRECFSDSLRKQIATENLYGFLLENGIDGIGVEKLIDSRCIFIEIQDQIISRFSKNFKTFQIKEDGSVLYSSNNAVIQSINFDESSYFNLTGFQIELICYKNEFADLGIIDPNEEFSFSDNSDGTVSMTHSISCSAINLDSDSIESANSFIQDRINNTFVPESWSYNTRILIEKREAHDTLSGKISVVLKYKFSPKDFMSIFSARECILNYSCQVSEQSNETKVSITGTIQGSIDSNISYVRDGVPEINFYNIAIEFLDHLNLNIDILDKADSFSFDENKEQSLISFNVVFSITNYDDPYIIDNFSVSQNFDENIYCASSSLVFKSSHGCPDVRMTKVKNYYNNYNINDFIEFKWAQFGNGEKLPTKTRSKSISVNEFDSTISESRKLCSDVGVDCLCFNNLKYSLSYSGGINKYSIVPTLEGLGCYSVQDLGYSERMTFQISGSADVSDCCKPESVNVQIKSICNYLSFKYFNADSKVLEEDSVSYLENKGIVEFSFKWSGKSVITF